MHTPPPPMPGPKQPTAQVPFAYIPSPAIPAGGISEFTKPTQPLLLLPFGFGFGFGPAASPGERGHQGSKYSQSLPLHSSQDSTVSRGHIQVPPQRPCSPLCLPMNIMHFLPLVPQWGPSIHDTPHCCYPPCQPVTSAVPTSGMSVPTHLTLKVMPTPPLGLLLTLAALAGLILEIPLPHFCSASGAPTPPGLLGMGLMPPQPRHLPAAPKCSLHCSFLHHHQTEVCRVLHIHRQRTHCGPIL